MGEVGGELGEVGKVGWRPPVGEGRGMGGQSVGMGRGRPFRRRCRGTEG